jgi:(p)ppGpp synthase/HD superfamily hydrolase
MAINYLRLAIQIACKEHEGQVDRQNVPYIKHVEYVAFHAGEYGIDAEIVGWLHDIVEDTHVTLNDLHAFGFPEHIINAVDAITRRYTEDTHDPEPYLGVYIPRVRANALARIVKLEDLQHNLSRIDGLPEERRAGMRLRYLKALEILQ